MVQWDLLRETMPEDAIEWRVQRSGTGANGLWLMVVPYASARWLMDRLDEVLGPDGWQTQMAVVDTGGMIERLDTRTGELKPEWSPPSILCGLAIQTDNGWVWKWDAAEFTDFAPTKGGATHAFRRACVPWNIGGIRRLYEAEGPLWGNVNADGRIETYMGKEHGKVRWDPPVLFGPGGELEGGGGPQRAGFDSRAASPGAGADAAQGGDRPADARLLDKKLTRGKHSGKTWDEVLVQDPDYVRWAISGTNWFTEAQKEFLQGCLSSRASEQEQAAAGPQDDGPEPYDDDLPF